MLFDDISIGMDIESIARFKDKTLEKDSHFLQLIFTPKELEYCFKSKFPEKHLCGRFCAKEAIVKALTPLGFENILYNEIEILNSEKSFPIANIQKLPNVKIKVSISHNSKYATANAIAIKE